MSKSWIAPLSGAGLLVLASMALSPVNAAVAGDEATATGSASPGRGPAPANAAYASEVPERDLIDNKDGTALAADQDDGSIPLRLCACHLLLELELAQPFDKALVLDLVVAILELHHQLVLLQTAQRIFRCVQRSRLA
jgi:hypothetical protein